MGKGWRHGRPPSCCCRAEHSARDGPRGQAAVAAEMLSVLCMHNYDTWWPIVLRGGRPARIECERRARRRRAGARAAAAAAATTSLVLSLPQLADNPVLTLTPSSAPSTPRWWRRGVGQAPQLPALAAALDAPPRDPQCLEASRRRPCARQWRPHPPPPNRRCRCRYTCSTPSTPCFATCRHSACSTRSSARQQSRRVQTPTPRLSGEWLGCSAVQPSPPPSPFH